VTHCPALTLLLLRSSLLLPAAAMQQQQLLLLRSSSTCCCVAALLLRSSTAAATQQQRPLARTNKQTSKHPNIQTSGNDNKAHSHRPLARPVNVTQQTKVKTVYPPVSLRSLGGYNNQGSIHVVNMPPAGDLFRGTSHMAVVSGENGLTARWMMGLRDRLMHGFLYAST